ncbi:anhydro-N-acetylmuramic acid kinase [Paludibacterium yongneupense]|uniref:anhydro-N-acetylmuramic acid kinase n=1 Tax=Paludibacterium yongneupense TaxID=400061 RepID=UPI00041F6530|nr:anhydro-N-acetylmuramic acid kinase [Paludibacterium yongneupense]
MTDFYIGLMSGTSLDGVDAVMLSFDDSGLMTIVADYSVPYPDDIRHRILALQPQGQDELARAARLANRLAALYAEAVGGVVHAAGISAAHVSAIGCHGQTIRHAPQLGYTLQIGNLALLAELTDIDVVGDFRNRDVAAGGQGAPLVPAFHHALFSHPDHCRVILNVGGISNLTILAPDGEVLGFDSGPGNMLMDAWCQRHLGARFDRDGAWAAGGNIVRPLLDALLADPFFAAPPPKSTGRDLFDLDWLDRKLAAQPSATSADVQATLLALSVQSVAAAVNAHAPDCREVFVCGGGARNGRFMRELAVALPEQRIATTDALGLPPQQVEAAAFGWLARRLLRREAGNLPSATGARGLRILGALYPR